MADRSIIVRDRAVGIVKALQELIGKQVLVGIPEAHDARTQSGPITNAALAYIHEFGAPAANIPARPFLIPGVRKAEPQYTPHLRAACNAALDGDSAKSDHSLVRAGIVAENSAKREISTGNFVPLSPLTIARRHESRQTQSMRKSEVRYLELVGHGMSPESAQAATGIRPLINTGQMRNSITSVVRRTASIADLSRRFRLTTVNIER